MSAKFLALVFLLAGCESEIQRPGAIEPGSAECRRLEAFLTAPGDAYGTQVWFDAVRLYEDRCTRLKPEGDRVATP